MADNDPFPALTNVVKEVMIDKLKTKDGSFSDMCAEDVLFEAPYAPGGGMTLRGRDQVAKYLPKVPEDMFTVDRYEVTRSFEDRDTGTVIVEFIAHAEGTHTKRPYNQRYINVLEVRNGEISRYSDYWNPLVFLWTVDQEGISAELAGEA